MPSSRTGVAAVDAVIEEAIGYGHRRDPVTPRTGGPAGNARLTSWAGVVLLGLSLAELVTLLDVTGLLGWHVGLGIVMTALAVLKTASTSWRIVRYYAGSESYGSAGPPPLILRMLGPLVIASTLGVLGSGLALVGLGQQVSEQPWFTAFGQQIGPLTLHQICFILFAVSVGLHALARVVPALLQISGRMRRGQHRVSIPGGGARALTLIGCIVAGVVALVLVLPAAGWQHNHVGEHQFIRHSR